MFHTPITFEIARLRHQENVRAAERHHRLFRRPFVVPPTPVNAPASVIPMPARGEHASPHVTRVA